MVNTDCPLCGEFMWIETAEDVQLGWTSGREWNRLQALIDMRIRYVWDCGACGHFEPVYGRVTPTGG